MKRFWFAAWMLMFGIAGGASAAPLQNGSFQNGGFEVGTLTGNPCNFSLPNGSTAITGWEVISGDIDYLTPTCWTPSEGTRSLDLVGTGSIGGIQQTFATVPGQTYQVIFDLAGNPSTLFLPAVKNLTVTVDGTPHPYTYDTSFKTTANMGWIANSFLFVAGAGGNTTISFLSDMTGSTFAGAALDNVRVAAVSPIVDAWTSATAAGNVHSGQAISNQPVICGASGSTLSPINSASTWNAINNLSYPLTITSNGTQGTVVASYDVPQGNSGSGICGSWTAAATSTLTGDVSVLWDYRGDHSSFATTVDLRAFVIRGASVVQSDYVVSNTLGTKFQHNGQYIFHVQPGDIYGFTMTGSNFDSSDALRGALTAVVVAPPPPTLVTTTTLASSANPSVTGSSVTLTATVTGNDPTGTVQFTDGGFTIADCSAPVSLSGTGNARTAECTTSGFAVGAHSIVAYYGGDAGNSSSQSAPLAQVMTPVIVPPNAWTGSAGSVTNNGVPIGSLPSVISDGTAGTNAVFTYATVNDYCCHTGDWNFETIATTTGPVTLNWSYSGYHGTCGATATLTPYAKSNGGTTFGAPVYTATDTCNFLPPAGGFGVQGQTTLQVDAGYAYGFTMHAGNGDFNGGVQGRLTVTTGTASTTTTVGISANPVVYGASSRLTAIVTGSSPTGTVTFTQEGRIILGCDAVPIFGGSASCWTVLPPGQPNIVALYTGDAVNAGSASSALQVTVNTGTPTATFVVDSTVDAEDNTPGDGICADSIGRCTLRAAVMQASAYPGAATITVPPGTYTLHFGGAIAISGTVAINGAGAANTIVEGFGLARVFTVSSGMATISGLTVRNGNGGITNNGSLTLREAAISDNTSSGDGGGILNLGAQLVLDRSTVSGNEGGGGAGIYSYNSTLTLTNSTVSENHSVNVSQCGFGGGGLWIYGGQATITNSTLFENFAECDGGGAGGRGHAIATTGGAAVTVRNSIFASPGLGGLMCYGPVTSLGYNLFGDATCSQVGSDLIFPNPQLHPLDYYSGPTPTNELLLGSPARDAVPAANCATALDQGGVATALPDSSGFLFRRPQGPACDIGAVESTPLPTQAATTTALVGTPNPATVGASVTFTATVTTTVPGNNPTGTVDFINGETPICSAVPLTGTGDSRTATCMTSSLPVGSWLISALYLGDTNDQSSSGQSTQVINDGAPAAAAPTIARVLATSSSTARVIGRADGAPISSITFEASAAASCDAGGLVGGSVVGTVTVTTDAEGYFFADLSSVNLGNFVAVRLTSPATTGMSACVASSGDNHFWPNALPIVGTASVGDYIDAAGVASWYKVSVTPGQQVQITLSGLPADYDLVVFKDIYAAFVKQLVPDGPAALTKLSAEFAPSTFSPSTFSPSTFSPSTFSPDAYAPSTFSPSTFSPSTFSPSTFSPSTFSPSTFSPSTFSPSTFSPSTFSPSTFSPSTFSPSTFSPSTVFGLDQTQVAQAFSSSQTRSIIGVSATPGNGNESVVVNTWSNTGDFYIRVSARGAAFATSSPFTLNVTKSATTCDNVGILVLPARPAVTGSNRQAIILTDSTRISGDSAALVAKLASLASSVAGAVVDLKDDARVLAYRGQADGHADCPYAKNLLAQEIKSIVDVYRAANPGMRYVVIAGNDNVVPFFRYPDESLLGQEADYVPPVASASASEASLRQNYVLGQDAYGASTSISMRSIEFPIPGLAVGRLVETAAEMVGMIDAYLANSVVTPQSSLVTGYDFLQDAADAVRSELAAGIGATTQPMDTLITPSHLSPESSDPRVWTAADLHSKLFPANGSRHDIIFLAGHFSANSALAADFSTSLVTTDLATSTTDFTNSIVFSAGCHAGYNIVDTDGIPEVTLKLDWPQAFAQKKATLIAGTGYQYGDTEFIEYSERLYQNFARQLRAGEAGTAISIGEALVKAKIEYLATTPDIRGLHQKALLEATVFGLPMLGVNMPSGRQPHPVTAGVINTALATGSAGTLGLQIAPLDLTPALSGSSMCLKNPPYDAGSPGVPPPPCPSGYTTAQWLTGPDGIVSNPAEPVLPLVAINVTPTQPSLVLRGVGFLGGSYTDSTIVPLTGAPTTELRGVHTPFLSPVFFPMRLSTPNYFGALSATGGTKLLVTPAQHRAADVALGTSTLRQFGELNLRLYYSGNTTATSLSAAPTIVSVSDVTDGATLTFTAHVVGDPAAAIHEAWVTYSSGSASSGTWTPLPLTQCSVEPPATTPPAVCGATADSQKWMAQLSSPPSNLKYIVQAVNGMGLVSVDDNLGAYYAAGGTTSTGGGTGGPTGPAATTLAFVSPPSGATYGDSTPVTVSLSAGTASVAGKLVTVAVGVASQSGVTDGSGNATIEVPISSLPGTYQLKASFSGDQDLLASSVSIGEFVVGKAASSLAPYLPLGATLTGAIGDNSRPIEGSVRFTLTSTTRPPIDVWAITDYLGRATLPPPGLPAGEYTVTGASYDGNSTYDATTATIGQSITIPKADQAIGFDALPGKTFGDPDFTVSATTSSLLPASFGASGACTVTGTSVHITAAGMCTITASLPPNDDFNAAPPVPRSFNVAPASSTTSLGASSTSPVQGQPVTLTATVTTTPGALGAPAGTTVTFKDGGTPIGAPVAVVGGTASLTTSSLAFGSHILTATFDGNANVGYSTGILNLAVGGVGTTTVLTADKTSPVPFGTTINFTATMTPVTATGPVTFLDGGTPLGTVTAVVAPQPATTTRATFATSTLGIGTHSLTASYAGNASNDSSVSAPLLLTIGESFTSTNPMLQARVKHTATLLYDGRVLVAGGYAVANGVPTRTAEIYCPDPYVPPATTPSRTLAQWCPNGVGKFSPAGRGNTNPVGVGNMVQARADHTATLLPDGTVLLAGGFDGVNKSSETAEIYDPTDPAADRFTAVGKMARGKSAGHAATLVTKGGKPMVLVTGGGNKRSDLYDPVTKKFTEAGDIRTERTNHTSTLVGTKVLLAGGADNKGKVHQTTTIYDIATGTWTNGPTMLAKRELHTATLLANGTVLLAGGRVDSGKNFLVGVGALAEVYDPGNATTPFAAVPFASATGRFSHSATALIGTTGLPDGRVVVAGGALGTSCGQQVIAASEVFASGAFASGVPLVAGRYDHAATLLDDGRVLLTGGIGAVGNACVPLSTAEIWSGLPSP